MRSAEPVAGVTPLAGNRRGRPGDHPDVPPGPSRSVDGPRTGPRRPDRHQRPDCSRQDRSRRAGGALLIALAVLSLVAASCGGSDGGETAEPAADQLSGYTREPTPSVAQVEFPLVAGGGTLPAAAPQDGLRIVYFGYTSCPDVCPTTMVDLKRALAQLPEDRRDRVEVVMVTVDPERDVDEKLTAYVTTFVPDGAASRFDDPSGLEAAAEAFGVQYSVETDDEGEVEVGHSADLYAVDDRGDVVLQWPFGVTEDDLASDIATLLDRTASA